MREDEYIVVTEDELNALPHYAQMVIAVRAVKRALPVAIHASERASHNLLEIITAAVQLLEEIAETGGQVHFDEQTPFDSLNTALEKLGEVITTAHEEDSPLLAYIAAAVEAFLIGVQHGLTRDKTVAFIVTIGIHNAALVLTVCHSEVVDAFQSAIRRDYDYLLNTQTLSSDHDTGSKCSVLLGPLWPDGEPDYWPAGSHPLPIKGAGYHRLQIEVKMEVKWPRHRPTHNNLLIGTNWLFGQQILDSGSPRIRDQLAAMLPDLFEPQIPDSESSEQTRTSSGTLNIYVVPQEVQDLWLKENTFSVEPEESSLPPREYVDAARAFASFDVPIKAFAFSPDATIADVVKESVGETPTCIARDELEECLLKHFGEDYDPKFLDIYLSTPRVSLSRGGIQTTGEQVFALNCKLKDANIEDGDILILRRLSVQDVTNQLWSDDLQVMMGERHSLVEFVKGYSHFMNLVHRKIEDFDESGNRSLQRSRPKLVLLYTNEDPQIAAYVRTHLHEIDKQSGRHCDVLVIERPLDRSSYEYWRELLHERLYVVWKLLGWANSRPYDKSEAYLLASKLGISFDKLPCAVELDSEALGARRIFTIGGDLTSCFRRIFSEYQPQSPLGDQNPLPIHTAISDETQTLSLNTSHLDPFPLCFLSYNSKDAIVVHEVAAILVSYGLDVWLDKWQIQPGDSIVDGIESGLLEADIVLVFLSPESCKSRWVEKEVNAAIVRAIETGSPTIVPVILSECVVPPLLSDYRQVKVGSNPLRIANEIRRITDRNRPEGTTNENFQHISTVREKMGKWREMNISNSNSITLLLLTADPTDASRLRLSEELREIQEKLQLAKLREQFRLHQRMSVRPADISQALLDIQPQIVHFSGHGTATGALCFENQIGETHPIEPEALAALFEQFADQVSCVVLNACYTEPQANAISQHIDYVIGMNKKIGDKAAIAFAIGFYQALGAGRTFEDAYRLGCVQIRLQGIPEHLTPVLIKKEQAQP